MFLFASMLAISAGCTVLSEQFVALKDRLGATETAGDDSGIYGTDSDVRTTVEIVKTLGNVRIISSQALRLPSVNLSSITVFEYQFSDNCGGHHFRVFESDESQILEFEYTPADRERSFIRDYLSGRNSFVQPGLWTAYDHTADSISGMNIRFEERGTGILVGTYSQGPFTGLKSLDKEILGMAYERAVRDIYSCQEAPAGRLDVAAKMSIA